MDNILATVFLLEEDSQLTGETNFPTASFLMQLKNQCLIDFPVNQMSITGSSNQILYQALNCFLQICLFKIISHLLSLWCVLLLSMVCVSLLCMSRQNCFFNTTRDCKLRLILF